MTREFLRQLLQLFELTNDLHRLGYKKKDIALQLQVFPSVYSSLVNGILQRASELNFDDPQLESRIDTLFTNVNNLSQVKIRRQIDHYIQVLQQLRANSPESPLIAQTATYLDNLRTRPANASLEKLIGHYDCYYLSTFGFRVKCEPLRLFATTGVPSLLVQKGNQLGPSVLEGFAYLSNAQVLTIQIQEKYTNLHDNLLAHFIVPPSYSETLNLLKGVMVSISNAGTPIARKIILKRRTGADSEVPYEELKTVFFDKDQPDNHPVIVQYLYRNAEYLEYPPIAHPLFDETDLLRESAFIS